MSQLNEMNRCPDCDVKPIMDFTNSFECSNCGREFDRDGVQIPNYLYPDTSVKYNALKKESIARAKEIK